MVVVCIKNNIYKSTYIIFARWCSTRFVLQPKCDHFPLAFDGNFTTFFSHIGRWEQIFSRTRNNVLLQFWGQI